MRYFISNKISVRSAGKKGRGVFVKEGEVIKKGEIVEVSPVIFAPELEYAHLAKTILAYHVYDSNAEERGVVVGLGYSSMYNHSFNPNADWENDKKSIKITATKTIQGGQEILFHYGWEDEYYRKAGIKL